MVSLNLCCVSGPQIGQGVLPRNRKVTKADGDLLLSPADNQYEILRFWLGRRDRSGCLLRTMAVETF